MTQTVPSSVTGSDAHPNDYYHQPGMALRTPPARIAPSPDWFDLRKRVLGTWRTPEPTPVMTPHTELVADHFWQGDEFMDPLIELALRTGVAGIREQFEQALEHGIGTVQSPPAELVRLFAHLDRIPEWFDAEQYERGRVALANQTLFGGLGGVIVNTVMTAQGAGVGSATGATGRFVNDFYRRAVETNEFFRRVSVPGSHERFSEGFKTNVRVRFMHTLVRANLRKKWGPESYETNGDPISAADMALGVPAYSTINLLIDNRLGYGHTRQELDDVTMFWSYTAYVFGVAEAILPRDSDAANEMFDFILSTYGAEPSKWAQELSQAFCNSLIESYVPPESGLRRAIGQRILLPALAGYFHFVCGSPVTDRMLEPLGYGDRLVRYSRRVGALARVAVGVQRRLDALPGRDKRRAKRAAAGIPFLDVQAKVAAQQAAQAGITEVTYRGHDSSEAGQFAAR